MSGALSQNVIFPSYGQRVETPIPPPALTYTLSWRSVGKVSAQQSNLVYTSGLQKFGALATYTLNLGNVIRSDSRTPFAQSMYVDNRANGVDVYISISGTNTGFTAPAFSVGMFPLIADAAPIINFRIHNIADGPTIVNIFAEILPPFLYVDAENGRAGQSTKTNCSVPIQILHTTAGVYNAPNVITWGAVTNNSGVYPIFYPETTGRMVIKAVQFDVTIVNTVTTSASDNCYLALCETIRDVNGLFYVNPIFMRFINFGGAGTSSGTILPTTSYNVLLDPPFMSYWNTNPALPLFDSGGAFLYNGPGLSWVVSSSNTIGDMYINSAFSVDVVLPSPYLGTSQNIPGM